MRKFLAALLILCLCAVILVPAESYAQPSGGPFLDKIHPDLWSIPEGEDWDVMVIMAEQKNTAKLAADTEQMTGTWVKGPLRRQLVRQAVVEGLQETAGRSQKDVLALLRHSRNVEKVAFDSFFIVNALHVTAPEKVIRALAAHPSVAAIEPVPVIELTGAVFSEEGVQSSASLSWNLEKVGVGEAWSQWNTRGEGIVIGVIDTGVDWQHPALKQAWRGYNPFQPTLPDPIGNWYDVVNPGNTLPVDPQGHGTHVTGIAVGYDPAADRQVGVAIKARWIAVNAFIGDTASGPDLLTAGQYMLAPLDGTGTPRPEWAPDIINNSWGTKSNDEYFRLMVQNWRSAGILPIFAAGNSGPNDDTIETPAGYPESLAVGNLLDDDSLASKSSRGPGYYLPEVMKPDLAAPGTNIMSSYLNGLYARGDGTSMAAPHVAGVAALIWSKHPGMSLEDLFDLLTATAQPLMGSYPELPNAGFGWGRVQAARALAGMDGGYWRITIENGVAAVESGRNLPTQTTVPAQWLGRNVTSLKIQALNNRQISQIQLPASLVRMDKEALAFNTLTTLTLPAGFTTLGERALYGNRLTAVTFPLGIQSINSLALDGNQADPQNLTVYGYPGTVAESYALNHGHTFISLVPVTITLTADPTVGGSVQGTGQYAGGSLVTVRAVPQSGYQFVSWTEQGVPVCADAEYIFTATSDRHLTAGFVPISYSIQAGEEPLGCGTIQGSGQYSHGTTVTLSAASGGELRFRYWLEDGARFYNNPYTFSALRNRNLQAIFANPILTRRISGENRYTTAAAISRDGWADSASRVVLARGDDFADALAGVPLAYHLDAPVLLTGSNHLSEATRTEILRLEATEVILLGGTSAIGTEVETELGQMGLTVTRIRGSDRYQTAAAVARYMNENGGNVKGAVLAVGTQFADALAASAHAARNGMPILLTRTASLPGATQTVLGELNLTHVRVVGGTSVIHDTVVSQLPQELDILRIAGANRYETAVALAIHFSTGVPRVAVATGLNFPDAIAGGVWAAKMGTGIILVDGTGVRPHGVVIDYLLSAGIQEVVLLGGTGVLSENLAGWF